MRIEQCCISDSVADFPFKESLGLTGYLDSSKPCLFIGCYSERDFEAIVQHNSKAVILWCGQDAIDAIFKGWYQSLKQFTHVTWMTNIEKVLRHFLPIKLVPPVLLGGNFEPSKQGSIIYAYCPITAEGYHRIDLINKLKNYFPEYPFLLGKGFYNQSDWLVQCGDAVYEGAFIGLCLSGFAGGGQTTLQLGLKGVPVITNVIDSPNVLNWETIEDIKKIITAHLPNIGKVNTKLSESVKIHLNRNPLWLEY